MYEESACHGPIETLHLAHRYEVLVDTKRGKDVSEEYDAKTVFRGDCYKKLYYYSKLLSSVKCRTALHLSLIETSVVPALAVHLRTTKLPQTYLVETWPNTVIELILFVLLSLVHIPN